MTVGASSSPKRHAAPLGAVSRNATGPGRLEAGALERVGDRAPGQAGDRARGGRSARARRRGPSATSPVWIHVSARRVVARVRAASSPATHCEAVARLVREERRRGGRRTTAASARGPRPGGRPRSFAHHRPRRRRRRWRPAERPRGAGPGPRRTRPGCSRWPSRCVWARCRTTSLIAQPSQADGRPSRRRRGRRPARPAPSCCSSRSPTISCMRRNLPRRGSRATGGGGRRSGRRRRSATSGGPSSTMRPASTTITRSAISTVVRRWAMITAVRSSSSVRSACCTSRSDGTSSDEVASSRMSTAGSARKARANDTSWRCPDDRRAPFWWTSVS